MRVKIISLKFDAVYGGFNDEVVQAFTKDKEIISVQNHFFFFCKRWGALSDFSDSVLFRF